MNFLNESSDSEYMTRKWNIVNDQSKANNDVGTETFYNTEVLKSNLCDYNNAYMLVRGDITVVGNNGTQVSFTNCLPFIKCITKYDGKTTKDLDLMVLMYNLLEYNFNYFDTIGSLSFYSKDEATNFNANIGNNNAFKSFKYKTKLLQNTVAQPASNNNDGILK